MRHLRGEALLAPEADRQPLQESIEGRRQARELVVGLTARKATVGVVLTPVRGLPRHLCDGLERVSEKPAHRADDQREQQERERDRSDQRRPLGLLVRAQAHAGHERPGALAVLEYRRRVEPGPADIERAPRPSGE